MKMRDLTAPTSLVGKFALGNSVERWPDLAGHLIQLFESIAAGVPSQSQCVQSLSG